MQKIIAKRGKQALMWLICIALLFGCMPAGSYTAYGAENRVTLSHGERVEYGTHFTTKMYVDGDESNVAYCLEPGRWMPDEKSYPYELLEQNSDLRKAMYYLQGGYGYDEYVKTEYLSGWSEDNAYAISHLVVSYIYDGYKDDGDAFVNTPESYIKKAKEIASAIKTFPAPPDSFKAFILKNTGGQDIVGLWQYEPNGWVELQKRSTNEDISNGNPNYSLAGAKYGIYDGDTLITTLITDENGYAKTDELEEKDYVLKELSPSPGFAIDTTSYDLHVEADNTTVIEVKEIPQSNPIEIVLKKIDAETGKSQAQGGASLAGAEFAIEFYAVDVNESIAGKDPARSWILKTDEKGEIKFEESYLVSGDDFYYQSNGDACLPLGKVVVKEKSPSPGYLLNEETFTLTITPEGTTETVMTYQMPAVPEQVKRGDLEFVKVSDGDLNRLAGVPFKITSVTTGESHILVTDENGYANTNAEWNLHTANTNRGETAEDGIWFGSSAPDNSKGALIYDDYVLEELRCEANEGMKLLKFEVSIYRDHVTVQLGTLTDDREKPVEIRTEAMDEASETKIGQAEGTVRIVDTVSYSGLQPGKEYKLIGSLMDKETGEPVQADGIAVRAEKRFTAKSSDGKVEVLFEVEGAVLKGKTVVVFEEMYRDDRLLAVHADIEDEGQTVYYPEIETEATDKDTGSHKSIANETVTIVDTVSYSGLQPGKTYTVKGVLMDKETEKPLQIDGKEITAEKMFTAESSSGSVTVEFAINARELDGKEIVVFETLYRGQREVAIHAEIEDQNQTVYFPEIETTASDNADEDKMIAATGEVTIRDTVKYHDLIAGETYTLKGILMDKETAKPILIDGKEVTAETTFIAEETDGETIVLFTFHADTLAGKELVVFETLYYANTEMEVANHENIHDDGQTVKVEVPPAEPPEETPPVKEPPEKEGTPDTNIPKTGDDTNLWIWIALFVASGSGAAAFRISQRKKISDEIVEAE